ncbi:MAG: MFS transporter [Deltaproteobacteria bacterium]|nr:MFS transporter [Deltaproteobacteria bacterium]
MAHAKWRTEPDHATTTWPAGVPFIVGNEACERFSFYGMRSILQVHLTMLFATEGLAQKAAEESAQGVVHLFFAGVYAFPMIGAIVADRLVGKYATIFWLSLVYCAGHGVLAMADDTLAGMYVGLALIAVGSGGIKPCVSANVGDQFGRGNWHLLRRIYQIFYFTINFGSFFASLLIPVVKAKWGASVAFAIPGILMGIATIIFWLGRHTYAHPPAKPGGRLGLLDTASSALIFMSVGSLFFTAHAAPWLQAVAAAGCLAAGLALFAVRQSQSPDDGFLAVLLFSVRAWFTRSAPAPAPASAPAPAPASFWSPARARFGPEAVEGTIAVLRVLSIFALVSVFWALFDQKASSWVRQAGRMDLAFDLPLVGAFKILPSQMMAVNPALVMLLIPFTSFVLYPAIERLGFKMSPLRRMTIGMFISATSFVAVALIQSAIESSEAAGSSGSKIHVAWQLIPYALVTLGEVLVSVTGLEFAYTQAPKRMKSTIMGFWMLTVTAGNVIVAILSGLKSLDLVTFFWVFAGLMALAGALFGLRAAFYTTRDFTQ